MTIVVDTAKALCTTDISSLRTCSTSPDGKTPFLNMDRSFIESNGAYFLGLFAILCMGFAIEYFNYLRFNIQAKQVKSLNP